MPSPPEHRADLSAIQPGQADTFADYFKLNFAPSDILAYFGTSLERRSLSLPQYTGALDRLADLKAGIEEKSNRPLPGGDSVRPSQQKGS